MAVTWAAAWAAVDAALSAHAELRAAIGTVQSVAPLAGLTNRVFRLQAAAGDFVLRLPRPENAALIDRQSEAHNLLLAAKAGIAVAPVFQEPKAGILLTRAVEPGAAAGEAAPQALGRLVGTLHRSAMGFRGRLDPGAVIACQRAELQGHADLETMFAPLGEALRELEAQTCLSGASTLVPSHGDLSPGNVLFSGDGLVLIDWEYSGLASPAWDLAYAILEHGFTDAEEQHFLQAYAAPEQSLEDLMLEVQRMKIRCDAVSALWALGQSAKANEATDFQAFATARIERALALFARLSATASAARMDSAG